MSRPAIRCPCVCECRAPCRCVEKKCWCSVPDTRLKPLHLSLANVDINIRSSAQRELKRISGVS